MLSEASRPRLAWWIVGTVLALVVGSALLAFTGTLVTALFLYYVSRPVYRRLHPRVGRSAAAAGAMLALALPVVLLVTYTVAIAMQEAQQLAQNVDLGPAQQIISPYFDVSKIVKDPASLLQNPDFVDALNLVVEGAFSYMPLVLSFLLHLFIALAVTFYLLRDGSRLAEWIRHTFGSETGVFDEYARAVDEDLSSVYFGNILNAVLAAIVAAITYHALNVFAPGGTAIPYPALLGLLVGAASLVPVVGMKIVYPPVAGLLLVQSVTRGDPLWFPIAFLVASAVVVDFIPDIVLRPYVSGRNLHVGLVMIAYVIGPIFFGWYGLFLGPLLLVLAFHFARRVLPELLDPDPVRPAPAVTDATGGDEYVAADDDDGG
jgi:predicted PurR-regulated permease PerM